MKLEIKNKNAKFYNEFHTTHYTVGQIQIPFHQKWLKSLNKHDDISGLFDRVLGHFRIGCAHPENYPFLAIKKKLWFISGLPIKVGAVICAFDCLHDQN